MKAKGKLLFFSWFESGNTIVDATGESKQEIKQPMALSGDGGFAIDTEIDVDMKLSGGEVADIVQQGNKDRKAILILTLEE